MAVEDELHDLKLRLVRLETQMGYIYRHLDLIMSAGPPAEDDVRIVELVKAGDVLEAVKRYQEITDSTLAEARQAVEELRKHLGSEGAA